MLNRLMGLETEYAVRRLGSHYFPLGNLYLFRSLMTAMRPFCDQVRGRDFSVTGERYFVQNGGAFYYEALPTAVDGGLVEGVTPECTSPHELLVYQKAQEHLLVDALRSARRHLPESDDGQRRLGLLKNCRDAYGHVHAAQENYEVEIAQGWRLWLLRGALLALAPAIIPVALALWTMTLVWVVPALAYTLVKSVWSSAARQAKTVGAEELFWSFIQRLARPLIWTEVILWAPITVVVNALLRLCAFRDIRRGAMAFFVSRSSLCGAGSLQPDGGFDVAEKATVVKRVLRLTNSPNDRPLIDTGNLLKRFMAPAMLRFEPFGRLFCRRQRLQLGFADANMAPAAEYLKLGMTALVLDMAEAGWLKDAPQPRDPIAALHLIARDPTLRVDITMKDGSRWKALAMQRYYLGKATRFVGESRTVSLEATRIVRLWREVLDALERDPQQLFGQLDWVTKKSLLERGQYACDFAGLKKIDLRYHELDDGYFEWLRASGLVREFIRPAEVDAAMKKPPRSRAARVRSYFIRKLAKDKLHGTLSWDVVKLGGAPSASGRRRSVHFNRRCSL